MDQRFRDIFPDIRIDESMRSLLEAAAVSRVTMNQSQSVMTVYLDSERLIHREILDIVQDEIRDQGWSPGP